MAAETASCLCRCIQHAARYQAMNKGIFQKRMKHTDPILKKSYEVFHGDLNQVDAIQSWSNA